MPTRHLAIIDPAVRVPELDCFNQLSLRAQIKTSYHLPALFGMESLKALENQISCFIILGSSSSVNDRSPWQIDLENWLKPQLETKKPALGFCYGHQMLGFMFGGKVDFLFADHHKLQGFRKIKLRKNSLWAQKELEGPIFVSHREAVMECPNSMQVIASSSEVSIDGLAHQTLPIWSVQSHPESTPVFLKNMGHPHNVDPQAFDFGKQFIDYFLAHVQKE
jgi:GMP synthase-like glutamine amidotransferase